ncbi:hypothetical protein D1AOALGA4SA_8537, partial [Olavius algarvensis Delta 1 endosymbiont]
AENLVLWARSEPIGYAVNLLQAGRNDGILEYWNAGFSA